MMDNMLIDAITKRDIGAVRELLERKADANAQLAGSTPLHHAARLGEKKVCKALLRARADLTLKDQDECRPSEIASSCELQVRF